MADACITHVVVPCGVAVLQGVFTCLNTHCPSCIAKLNTGAGQNTFVEQILPVYLFKKHGEKELATLVKLHQENKQAIIGVTGCKDVGKTVLLQRFNNELGRRRDRSFGKVIFVSGPRQKDCSADDWIREVQNTIATALHITEWDDNSSNYNARANAITLHLQKENFVVIIDNVIRGALLKDLGIPTPNGSGVHRKIVFSSLNISSLDPEWRTPNVVHLSPMDEAVSWELFSCTYLKFGPRIHKHVENTAREAVQLCNGLPEPIVHLANKMGDLPERERYWKDFLLSHTNSLNDLFDKILPDERYTTCSVDRDMLTSCFLFCSLFPLERYISKVDLINYWVCEGLFTPENVFRNTAEIIIEDLLRFSLLHSADELNEEIVKVIFVYGKVALEIAAQADEKTIHVQRTADSRKFLISELNNCQQALRASLVNTDIEELVGVPPDCPHLRTLIISRNSNLRSISTDIFSRMPSLRVLDLSHTSITEISPGIRALVSLRSLNLSFTPITRLAPEMVELKKLENLYLENTERLQELPTEVLSHLAENLHILKMNNSYENWSSTSDQDDQTGKVVYILKLEEFKKLEYLAITINSEEILQAFVRSERLKSFTKNLHLNGYRKSTLDITDVVLPAPDLDDISVTSSDQVRELIIDEDRLTGRPDLKCILLSNLAEMEVKWTWSSDSLVKLYSLSSLTITACNKLKNVSWALRIPFLKYLTITRCQKLKTLVEETLRENPGVFSTLKNMTLEALPELISICNINDTIGFESLESLRVTSCSKLLWLALPENRPKNLISIQGELSWWDKLKWRSNNQMFKYNSPIFRPNGEVLPSCACGFIGQVCCSSCYPSS